MIKLPDERLNPVSGPIRDDLAEVLAGGDQMNSSETLVPVREKIIPPKLQLLLERVKRWPMVMKKDELLALQGGINNQKREDLVHWIEVLPSTLLQIHKEVAKQEHAEVILRNVKNVADMIFRRYYKSPEMSQLNPKTFLRPSN